MFLPKIKTNTRRVPSSCNYSQSGQMGYKSEATRLYGVDLNRPKWCSPVNRFRMSSACVYYTLADILKLWCAIIRWVDECFIFVINLQWLMCPLCSLQQQLTRRRAFNDHTEWLFVCVDCYLPFIGSRCMEEFVPFIKKRTEGFHV